MNKIEVRMAMMSHLSDAQELISMGYTQAANKEINFVKLMTHQYHNLEVEVAESELNELWSKLEDSFGNYC